MAGAKVPLSELEQVQDSSETTPLLNVASKPCDPINLGEAVSTHLTVTVRVLTGMVYSVAVVKTFRLGSSSICSVPSMYKVSSSLQVTHRVVSVTGGIRK